MTEEPRHRLTLRELIILVLAIGAVAVLVLSVLMIGITKIAHPELDLLPVAQLLGQATQMMVGVVVGYLVGRPMGPGER